MSTADDGQAIGRVHFSFWVIGVVALLWHVGGVANFIIQMTNAEMIESYRASERAIIDGRPLWATSAFATATIAGALGCALLLLKRSDALFLFALSLLGVIGTMIHALTAGIDFNAGEIAGTIVMPLVMPAFLIFYTKAAEKRGSLKRLLPGRTA